MLEHWSVACSSLSHGKMYVAGVKVGDTVLLPDYGGQAVNLGHKEKEMFLYSDQDILGIIEQN